MISPATLKEGDTIGICATAKKISFEEIALAQNLFESAGFRVKIGKTIGAEDGYFAGETDLRIRDFQEMLDDNEIKAIICARGGYGTVQIVDKLDFSRFVKNPKWIVGFSDITVLHSHIQLNYNIQTLHATMPIFLKSESAQNSETVKSLLSALQGAALAYDFSINDKNQKNIKTGKTTGELFGGNLSVLYSLCGSQSFPHEKIKNKILFIEDLDEYLYHIDRMMMNLKRNGIFNNIKGLIVGAMSEMNDTAVPYGKAAEEIIYTCVKDYDFPLVFDFPAGHIETNLALKMGAKVQLEIKKEAAILTFDTF